MEEWGRVGGRGKGFGTVNGCDREKHSCTFIEPTRMVGGWEGENDNRIFKSDIGERQRLTHLGYGGFPYLLGERDMDRDR